MEIKIPTTFQLHGQTFSVKVVDHLGAENGNYGETRLGKNEIVLQGNASGYPRSQAQLEQTFLHEVVHCILGQMGQKELCEDEVFVDLFSNLFHQMLVSSEYDVRKKGAKRGR